MLYIFFSIICSVSVGVLLKIAKRFSVDIIQIITVNYGIALSCSYFVYEPDLSVLTKDSPWEIYSSLAILLPSVFLLLAYSIKYMGIVKTDIAQRFSLFIPILAAYFIFKEEFNFLKIIGLAIGFPAIFLILSRKSDSSANEKKWIFPALVLVGFGVIDILFKKIALQENVPYTTSLFVVFWGALIVAVAFSLYSILIKKRRIGSKNIYFGIILGLLNFGNILFYLKAHKALSSNPSTVFAGMNLGVIILGSLVGILVFKERISTKNYFGIFLALVSIVIITISQFQVNL